MIFRKTCPHRSVQSIYSLVGVIAAIVFLGTGPASALSWTYAVVNGKCYRTLANPAPPAPMGPWWHLTTSSDPKCRTVPVNAAELPLTRPHSR